MNNVTLILENKLKDILGPLRRISEESAALEKMYFATGASTEVSALATDATAATSASKLTKAQVISAITLIQQLQNFFGNSAVTQADYRSTCESVANGNASGASPSVALEALGTRLKQVALDLIELQKRSLAAIEIYNDNSVGTAFGSLPAQSVVFGASMTVSELLAGITLISEFSDLMGNAVVTTGDYQATLSLWERHL